MPKCHSVDIKWSLTSNIHIGEPQNLIGHCIWFQGHFEWNGWNAGCTGLGLNLRFHIEALTASAARTSSATFQWFLLRIDLKTE